MKERGVDGEVKALSALTVEDLTGTGSSGELLKGGAVLDKRLWFATGTQAFAVSPAFPLRLFDHLPERPFLCKEIQWLVLIFSMFYFCFLLSFLCYPYSILWLFLEAQLNALFLAAKSQSVSRRLQSSLLKEKRYKHHTFFFVFSSRKTKQQQQQQKKQQQLRTRGLT